VKRVASSISLDASPADADLRVLDVVLSMLRAGRARLETSERGSGCDYAAWARDLLTQLLAMADPETVGHRYYERLAVAHRALARAACEGDAAVVAEVAEFLEAIRHACGQVAPTELRASSSAA